MSGWCPIGLLTFSSYPHATQRRFRCFEAKLFRELCSVSRCCRACWSLSACVDRVVHGSVGMELQLNFEPGPLQNGEQKKGIMSVMPGNVDRGLSNINQAQLKLPVLNY